MCSPDGVMVVALRSHLTIRDVIAMRAVMMGAIRPCEMAQS